MSSLFCPSSPSGSGSFGQGYSTKYLPTYPSPLKSSSPPTSPVSSPTPLAARRRSQYKALTPCTPTPKRVHSKFNSRTNLVPRSGSNLFGEASKIEEPPQKTLMRERFRAKCFERAKKARDSALSKARGGGPISGSSSDGPDDDMDLGEDDDPDLMLNDEFFSRIIASLERKKKYKFQVSYEWEVGSSIDPDMEDVCQLEKELHESSSSRSSEPLLETTPADLEAEELAAYAEDAAYYQELEELADECFDEDFDLSDFEDTGVRKEEKDVDMVMDVVG